MLAINAADDERNPPETGLMERERKRVQKSRLLLIPANEASTGHGTTASAKWYAMELQQLLQTAPKRRPADVRSMPDSGEKADMARSLRGSNRGRSGMVIDEAPARERFIE